MSKSNPDPISSNIYYPPGGMLIWMIILMELAVFALALIALVYYSKEDPSGFHESRVLLNPAFGLINTLFLLCSGFFMAESVKSYSAKKYVASHKMLGLAIAGGLLFLGLKSVEYVQKIAEGITFDFDTFFNFYWLLTGFHVVHVLVGLGILISIFVGSKRGQVELEDYKASGAFWHLCDLIWLLLFPMLYLIF